MNWTRILPDLYLGSCPQSQDDLEQIAALGVGVIVNLQTDEDMERHSLPWPELCEAYETQHFEFARVSMNDHELTSVQEHLPEAIETLRRFLDDGWAVYLHCTSGVNRAPTVAIAYLATHGELTFDDAVSHVTGLRECLPFLDAIEEIV